MSEPFEADAWMLASLTEFKVAMLNPEIDHGYILRRLLLWHRAGLPLGGDYDKDYDDERGLDLGLKADRGDSEADAYLCYSALDYILRGKPLPGYLRGHIYGLLLKRALSPGKRGRGGNPDALFTRNMRIAALVRRLQTEGIPPTRHRAACNNGAGRSGCSMVAEALAKVGIHIDETGIEKIWAARSRYGVRR
jgi:hypothetical protein